MQETMNLSLFLTFTSFLCACVGAPRERPRQDDGSVGQFIFPVWPITNFNGRCSPGGCLSKSTFPFIESSRLFLKSVMHSLSMAFPRCTGLLCHRLHQCLY